MAAATDCTGCGSSATVDRVACPVCGAGGSTGEAVTEAGPGAAEGRGGAAPQLWDVRRIRGKAAPFVAAAVVAGIGIPLTLAAVTVVPGSSGGDVTGQDRARLAGAVSADGAATPVGCRPGDPLLVTVGNGSERYSILLSVPAGSTAGTYLLKPDSAAFVTVSHPATSLTWTSRAQADATGEITLREDGRMSATFRDLGSSSSKASGTVEGAVEVRCG